MAKSILAQELLEAGVSQGHVAAFCHRDEAAFEKEHRHTPYNA